MMRPSVLIEFLWTMLRLKVLNLASRFPPLPGGVLDEQTALLRRGQILLGERPLEHDSAVQARAGFEESIRTLKGAGGLFEKVHAVRDLLIPGAAGNIPARLYLPDEAPGHALFVFLHGGGWVIGSLETGDNMARFLCRRAGCAVLSVDYRLAPEHPFPAAVEDTLTALRWAAEHAIELGGDPERLLVGGDSAGGTLSAVAAQLLRSDGPRLAGQCLFYPGADCVWLDTSSYREFGAGAYGLPKRDVEWFLNQYVPPPLDRRDPRVSPLLASNLSGLPPALVVTSEFDVLRDEGEAYALRMQDAGVPVTLLRCNGMIHGFLTMIGLIQRATRYFDTVAAEVRRMAG